MAFIRRPKRDKNYTTVDNDIIQDSSLRWDERGFLIYLLHLPDNWQINVADLVNRAEGVGRDGVYSLIERLCKKGYMSKEKIRDKGRIMGYDYTVYETKQPTISGIAVNGEARNGSAVSGKSDSSKYYIVDNTKEEVNTKDSGEDTLASSPPPVLIVEKLEPVEGIEVIEVKSAFETKETPTPPVAPAPLPRAKKPANPDPAPTKEMWERYAQEYATLTGAMPASMPRDFANLAQLYKIIRPLVERATIPGDVPDVKGACLEYISAARMVAERDKWIRGNFTPGILLSQFNSLQSKIRNNNLTKFTPENVARMVAGMVDDNIPF